MNLDTKALDQLKNDVGPEVLPVIMASFVTELGQRLDALRQALENENLAELQAHAHSVKSTARTVGLQDLGDTAAQVDDLARAGDLAATLDAAVTLVEQCEQGLTLIQQWSG